MESLFFEFTEIARKIVRRRWRELGILLGLYFIWSKLAGVVGGNFAFIVLLLLVALALAIRPVRARIFAYFKAQRLRTLFARAISRDPVFEDRSPQILKVENREHSSDLTVRLQPGTTANALEKLREDIAVNLRLGNVRVIRDNADASIVHVKLVRGAPLSGRILFWSDDATGVTSLWNPISVGVDEDGESVSLYLPENNLIAGGEPGAGKSVFLVVLLNAILRDPSVKLFIFDGKHLDLVAYARVSDGFVGCDIELANEQLNQILAMMDERYARLRELGLKKVNRDCGLGLVVTIIDELPYYVSSGKQGKEFAEKLRDLLARGRAAGMIVILTAQKPSSDTVPTAIRDLVSLRVAFRCGAREASESILGQGWSSQGYSASSIPLSDRGVGYFLGDAGFPQLFRSYFVNADTEARVINVASKIRPLEAGDDA